MNISFLIKPLMHVLFHSSCTCLSAVYFQA